MVPWGLDLFLSLFRESGKGCWVGSVVRWSKGSCFKSTKVNPWHSQTTNRSIRDHFSIKQNHQGPSQRRLTNIWKNPKFGQFQWGGRWDGGDWPTSSKWFETKFPETTWTEGSGQMGTNPKTAEPSVPNYLADGKGSVSDIPNFFQMVQNLILP